MGAWDWCACGHPMLLHDIEDYEDEYPTCCAEGCDQSKCPKPPTTPQEARP